MPKKSASKPKGFLSLLNNSRFLIVFLVIAILAIAIVYSLRQNAPESEAATTWTKVNLAPLSTIRAMECGDPNTCFAAGTANGANNFITFDNSGAVTNAVDINLQSELLDIYLPDDFATSDVVMARANFGDIFRSTDGGDSFVAMDYANVSGDFGQTIGADFLTGDDGVFVNNFGEVYRTVDGGVTYDPAMQVCGSCDSRAIDYVDLDTIVVAGIDFLQSTGAVFVTTDAGLTWTTNPTPLSSSANIESIQMIDASTGYLATGDFDQISFNQGTYIYKTTDGGATWTEVFALQPDGINTFTYNPVDMKFFDEDTGYVMNQDGSVFFTDDGGSTWTQEIIPSLQLGSIMWAAAATSPSNVWIGGDTDFSDPNAAALLLHKEEVFPGNWNALSNPILNEINDIKCNASNRCIAVGSSDTANVAATVSNDGGLTWFPATLNAEGVGIELATPNDGELGINSMIVELPNGDREIRIDDIGQGVNWLNVTIPAGAHPSSIANGTQYFSAFIDAENLNFYSGGDIYFYSLAGGLGSCDANSGCEVNSNLACNHINEDACVFGARMDIGSGDQAYGMLTIDGGLSWYENDVSADFAKIHAVANNPANSYVQFFIGGENGSGNGVIQNVRVYDGYSGFPFWQVLATEVLSGGAVLDIHMDSEFVGFAVTDDGMVYRTIDGGNNWEAESASASGGRALNSVFGLSQSAAWSAGIPNPSDLGRATVISSDVSGSALCGNGLIDGSEQCDDGNALNGDGCSIACLIEVPGICGDGAINTGEQCDDGNTITGDGCDDLCQIEVPVVCGDGVVDGAEICDDGNTVAGDGCAGDCSAIDPGYECPIAGNACNLICSNGVVDPGETCDDGNLVDGDGCNSSCQVEAAPQCGDGNVDPGEDCDDGLANSDTAPDACRTNCQFAFCGDSITDTGESCDNGPANSDVNPDACRTNCVTASCGDLIVDSGESCDDGNILSGDGCDGFCQLEISSCGDGLVGFDEECDDGNLNDNDGCDSSCEIEVGAYCTGEPSVCTDACGDGLRSPAEACDDGNTVSGDGCNEFCEEEPGYACNEATPTSASQCGFTCGNGVLDQYEECDAGIVGLFCGTATGVARCEEFAADYSNRCESGANAGQTCTTNTDCPGSTCEPTSCVGPCVAFGTQSDNNMGFSPYTGCNDHCDVAHNDTSIAFNPVLVSTGQNAAIGGAVTVVNNTPQSKGVAPVLVQNLGTTTSGAGFNDTRVIVPGIGRKCLNPETGAIGSACSTAPFTTQCSPSEVCAMDPEARADIMVDFPTSGETAVANVFAGQYSVRPQQCQQSNFFGLCSEDGNQTNQYNCGVRIAGQGGGTCSGRCQWSVFAGSEVDLNFDSGLDATVLCAREGTVSITDFGPQEMFISSGIENGAGLEAKMPESYAIRNAQGEVISEGEFTDPETSVFFDTASSTGSAGQANCIVSSEDGTEISLTYDGETVVQPIVPGGTAEIVFGETVSDSDGDGIEDNLDACPDIVGSEAYSGCPVAGLNIVKMKIKDWSNSGVCSSDPTSMPDTEEDDDDDEDDDDEDEEEDEDDEDDFGPEKEKCKVPVEGAMVRVFDRKNEDFRDAFGRNPDDSEYGEVFESGIGQVSACMTGADGTCLSPEPETGKYLVIVRYQDFDEEVNIYIGKKKKAKRYVDTADGKLATKRFKFRQRIDEDGQVHYRRYDQLIPMDQVFTLASSAQAKLISAQQGVWSRVSSSVRVFVGMLLIVGLVGFAYSGKMRK